MRELSTEKSHQRRTGPYLEGIGDDPPPQRVGRAAADNPKFLRGREPCGNRARKMTPAKKASGKNNPEGFFWAEGVRRRSAASSQPVAPSSRMRFSPPRRLKVAPSSAAR